MIRDFTASRATISLITHLLNADLTNVDRVTTC